MYHVALTLSTIQRTNEELLSYLADNKILLLGITRQVICTIGGSSSASREFAVFTPSYLGIHDHIVISRVETYAIHHGLMACLPVHALYLAVNAKQNMDLVSVESERAVVLSQPIGYEGQRYCFVISKRQGFIALNLHRYETPIFKEERLVGIKPH